MNRFNHILQKKILDNPEADIQEESSTEPRGEHSLGLQSSFHYKTGEMYFSGSKNSNDNSYYIAIKKLPDFYLHAQLLSCPYVIDTFVEYVDPSNASDIIFALTCLEIIQTHGVDMDDSTLSDISLIDLARISNEDRAKKSGMNIRGFNRNLFISKFLHFNEGKYTGNGFFKDTATVIPLKGFGKIADWLRATELPVGVEPFTAITIADIKKIIKQLRKEYKNNTVFQWDGQILIGEEAFYAYTNKQPNSYIDKLWISNEIKCGRLTIDDSSSRAMLRGWLHSKNFSSISEKEYAEINHEQALRAYKIKAEENKKQKLEAGKIKDESDIFYHDVVLNERHLQNLVDSYWDSPNETLKKAAKKSEELLKKIDEDGKISVQFYTHHWGNRKYEVSSLLQNIESEVRDIIFLDGDSYSLDMEASAANLLLQIGQKLTGNDNICPQLKYYVENKKQVRQQIADDCSVNIGTAKRALTATLFGGLRFPAKFLYLSQATETLKKFKCSPEKLDSLSSHHLISGLVNEVKAICDIITKKYYNKKTKEITIPALFKDKGTGLQALYDLDDARFYSATIEGRYNVGKVVSFAYVNLPKLVPPEGRDFLG